MRSDGSIDTDEAMRDLGKHASEASKRAMEKCLTLSESKDYFSLYKIF